MELVTEQRYETEWNQQQEGSQQGSYCSVIFCTSVQCVEAYAKIASTVQKDWIDDVASSINLSNPPECGERHASLTVSLLQRVSETLLATLGRYATSISVL